MNIGDSVWTETREIWIRTVSEITRGIHMVKIVPSSAEPGVRRPGSIIVVYENAAAREGVVEAAHELATPAAGEAGSHVKWWSFASLCDSAVARDAANEVLDARLVVFAITSAGDLPQEMKLWIETWINRRSAREGAIVGFVPAACRSGPGEIACLKEIYLRHAAHRAAMDYLSQMPGALPKAMPDSPDSYSKRAGQVTSLLDEILRTWTPPPTMCL